jgi:hypothetical protein
MSRTTKLTFKFMRELNSDAVQETFETLSLLLDHLENKNDPEPSEVQLVDTAYQALEKLKTLEGLIKNHIGENDNIVKGNKLEKLYERNTQSLFD